jgi:hypothetical protein
VFGLTRVEHRSEVDRCRDWMEWGSWPLVEQTADHAQDGQPSTKIFRDFVAHRMLSHHLKWNQVSLMRCDVLL